MRPRFKKTAVQRNTAKPETAGRVGLARVLSKLGFCSRNAAAELIRTGRVSLNGVLRRDPEFPTHLESDSIEVNGRRIEPSRQVYFMLNKPRGIVTTVSDEKGRRTVYDLVDSTENWIAPVGRLDKASEGLLLLTNDSGWAARVLAPQTHLSKTYHVQIGTIADDMLLETLRQGVQDGGDFLRVKSAAILRQGKRNSWLEIVLDEGKNRHIRRMFNGLGIEVLRLVRIAIGPVVLGQLPKGASRPLTPAEKRSLDQVL